MSQKIVVIGGGASGFLAAITAAKAGASVTILEQNSKLGKKILSTGNGKCNLTNLNQQKEYYRCSEPEFPYVALNQFTLEDTISFFHEIGIYTKNKNGYLYPHSEQASSVVEVLEMEARRLKVKLKTNERVTHIECLKYDLNANQLNVSSEAGNMPDNLINGNSVQNDNQRKTEVELEEIESASERFLVHTESWHYPCDSVIISCGSSASVIEGSNGSGYELAKKLGHTIVKPLPALTGLKGIGTHFSKWAGVRVEAKISLMINGKPGISEKGELQLTDYGISGIPVFQISRYASRAIDEGKTVTAIIDFLPDMTIEECQRFFQSRRNNRPNKSLKEQFVGVFPGKLIEVLVGNAKEKNIPMEEIVSKIKNLEIKIKGTLDLDHAQVCTGGVSCKEINPETMESKLVPGVYFCGEVLDVDGTCGGYNLQWAWSSGYVAGKSAIS